MKFLYCSPSSTTHQAAAVRSIHEFMIGGGYNSVHPDFFVKLVFEISS